MDISRATAADWPAVSALLVEAELTLDGATEAFATGVVARDGSAVAGCAAIEPYAGSAFLRSVAVRSDQRGLGIGTHLVDATEQLARDIGAAELYLLTETAEGWFARRGYTAIDRTAVPDDVAGSVEFVRACSVSAVAMRRTLR